MDIIEGQITIYTITGCPHCLQAKQTLKKLELYLVEVSVDKYPSTREFLKTTTGKSSLPQIFFNDTHIGGNDSLQSAIKDTIKWQELMITLQQPYNSKLLIPSESEQADLSHTKFTCKPDSDSVVLDELIDANLAKKVRTSLLSFKHEYAFSGQSFVHWLSQTKNTSEDESLAKGCELVAKKFLIPVTDPLDKKLKNDPNTFYRLNDCSSAKALNSGPIRNCQIDSGAELATALRNLILQLYSEFISSDGKSVDYAGMSGSDGFREYEEMSRLLHRVSPEAMTQDERKAFFINVYNALVVHATVAKGAPGGILTRLKFFASTKYVIGGLPYSLNDVENGVLRANRRGVLGLVPPFGKDDPRRRICLHQVDPRIHFALNCGAKSCPPIKTFSAKNIDEELTLATQSFLEGEEGVKVSTSAKGSHDISLSSLLRWYATDFGASTRDVIEWVRDALSPSEKKEAIGAALGQGNWRVKYMPYDWGSNAKE